MDGFLLVLNAGSSSLKFAVFRWRAGELVPEARGQVEGLGAAPRFRARDAAGRTLTDEPAVGVTDGHGALEFVTRWLEDRSAGGTVLGVGHRVVHGGQAFPGPTRVTAAVLEALRALIPLAPLHQPHNLAAIEAVARRLPGTAQVACFDTSFHRGRPAMAELVALPADIRATGVQRYGFHGISCEYIASMLPDLAPDLARGRVLVAHLGSGASLCAIRAGRAIDSSFGFTALDGLCMGTRPGALDPGIVLHLIKVLGLSGDEVEDLLYRRSGLLALSGESSDMRELLASAEPAAKLAVEYFVYRAVREIGGLVAVLGGLDGLVFTAGIGEGSAEIRQRICAGLAWLGIRLDPAANGAHATRISAAESAVQVLVIPTNEELMIARHTAAVLGLS